MKRILCTALCLLPLALAFGQDDAAAPAAKTFSLKFSGDHEFLDRLPVGSDSWNTGYSGEAKMPKFRNEVGIDVKEGPINLVSHWQVDTALGLAQNPADQWAGSTRVRNLENYIAWNPDNFRVAAGYQIYAWGVADGRNPTDNINPGDYTTMDGNKPHKIPVLSASVNWYPTEQISLETVFVPQATNSVSPLDYQKMLLANGFRSVTYKDMDSNPANFIAGGKLNYRTTAADFSVSYLYDLDTFTPVITTGGTPATTDILLERKRIHRIGADAKTTIDRFGLWAETCYSATGNFDSSNSAERLSRLDYTLGFDFNYGPQDAYYLNLQYTGSVIPGYNSGANTDTSNMTRYYERALVGYLAGEREAVTQGITWNAHWNLADETVVPTFTGSYSLPFGYDNSAQTRYGNLLLRPEVDVMPVDSFHITAGFILAYAFVKNQGDSNASLDTTQDNLGIYTPSNALFVNVSYKWTYETTK